LFFKYTTYFNTKKRFIFSTEVTRVFLIMLNKSKLFLYQHFATSLCNANATSLVFGTNQAFAYYLGYTQTSRVNTGYSEKHKLKRDETYSNFIMSFNYYLEDDVNINETN